MWKFRIPQVSFEGTQHSKKVTSTTNGYNHPRFGTFLFTRYPTRFDMVEGSTGEIIIPRETMVASLIIPRINFSNTEGNAVITPKMVNNSLDAIADHISQDRHSSFVIGLTHPRMGDIAKRRWGFHLENRPFPKEVYGLFDIAPNNAVAFKASPDDLQDLKSYRDQVLVYQAESEFLNNVKKK